MLRSKRYALLLFVAASGYAWFCQARAWNQVSAGRFYQGIK